MTKYLNTNDYASCYGCRACEHICPKNAIAMVQNEEGFLYPKLDESKCIRCGLCQKACPYDSAKLENKEPLCVYAAQYKNREALQKSSSGGIFSAVADYVLERNGAIAGCIFNEKFEPIHVVTKDKDTIKKMQGSKYVQSDIQYTYPQIKELLGKGTLVLFSGTPCQIEGLKKYLQKDYENLITMDLICHGVPSPKLLSAYLESERRNKGTVTDLKFRNKERNGWCSRGNISYKDKIKTISPFNNSYYYYYLKNNVNRMSCYSCKYSSTDRVGDISIGDYWNLEDVLPNIDTKWGYSVVLVNSQKGKDLIENIKSSLILYETDLHSAVKGNGNLSEPCEMPESRKTIYKRIEKDGYDVVAKQDCKYSYLVPFIRKHMPRCLKKFIKKLRK